MHNTNTYSTSVEVSALTGRLVPDVPCGDLAGVDVALPGLIRCKINEQDVGIFDRLSWQGLPETCAGTREIGRLGF
jgi:hypothetical protein